MIQVNIIFIEQLRKKIELYVEKEFRTTKTEISKWMHFLYAHSVEYFTDS